MLVKKKKIKNLHSYLYYFIFLIGVLAHHQSRTVESGFVEIAFLHVSMAFHKSLTKLFYYLLLFFKESFNWEMCLLQYTTLETVALNVSTRKCCPEPASRAAAFRIIWWNADSSMNCYKGKYAHKTNLNFYGNELQISWAEFVLRPGRFACSDNGLFCFSETCGKPGMHGWVVIPPLGESFPCCFHSLQQISKFKTGETYRSCSVPETGSISNVFSSVWCGFSALGKEFSVASAWRKFYHQEFYCFSSSPCPCFDTKSNFRETVCS